MNLDPDTDGRAFRPIGWWARLLDERITAGMTRVLAAWSLDRLGWQVLNLTARAAPIDRATLVTGLAPFASVERVGLVVDELHRRGWLAPGAIAAALTAGRTTVVLTPEGRTTHRAMVAAIEAFRDRMRAGVTPEEYATTVATLRRMSENLTPPPTGAAPP